VDQISVAVDHGREGAGPTRNRAKNALRTDWTLFLDDDDEMLPDHVDALFRRALETGADVVYPWFVVVAGGRQRPELDPFPQWAHAEWDPAEPHIFPITALVRTELAQSLDFGPPASKDCAGEDWPWWKALNDAGAAIRHLDRVTWRWHWDPKFPNTSGVPSRW
jgi:hypothetical protein